MDSIKRTILLISVPLSGCSTGQRLNRPLLWSFHRGSTPLVRAPFWSWPVRPLTEPKRTWRKPSVSTRRLR